MFVFWENLDFQPHDSVYIMVGMLDFRVRLKMWHDIALSGSYVWKYC